MEKRLLAGLIILVICAIAILFQLKLGNSFSWSAVSSWTKPNTASEQHTLEVAGSNARIYYFTNKHGQLCTALFGSEGVGLSCKGGK